MNDPTHPKYLDFHGGGWFAEVTTKFIFTGSEQYLFLCLQLEKDTVGSKWVITNVFFEPFQAVFADQDSLRKAGCLPHCVIVNAAVMMTDIAATNAHETCGMRPVISSGRRSCGR